MHTFAYMLQMLITPIQRKPHSSFQPQCYQVCSRESQQRLPSVSEVDYCKKLKDSDLFYFKCIVQHVRANLIWAACNRFLEPWSKMIVLLLVQGPFDKYKDLARTSILHEKSFCDCTKVQAPLQQVKNTKYQNRITNLAVRTKKTQLLSSTDQPVWQKTKERVYPSGISWWSSVLEKPSHSFFKKWNL